jgi:hypothetical protein
MSQKYIEDQNKDSAFKIWDEKKDSSSLGVSSDTKHTSGFSQ